MRLKRHHYKDEAEVAAIVVADLERKGFEVWAELEHIDIVAKRGDEVIGVEVKQRFTPKLLMQAMRARAYCCAAYMAFPKVADHATIYLADAGAEVGQVGIMEILHWGYPTANRLGPDEVIIRRLAPNMGGEPNHRLAKLMVPEAKGWTTAGRPGCRVVTPFRITALRTKDYVAAHPGCTVADVLSGIHHHWSKKAAPQRMCMMIESGAIEGVRLEERNGLQTKLFPASID